MLTVSEGAIVLIHVGNQVVDEPVAKPCSAIGIPVPVIGKYHDKRLGFIGMDKLVCVFGHAKAYPLIIYVGLPMKQVKDRVTGIG